MSTQSMMLIPFDTLAFANKLKEAGLEPKIAEAQAELQAAVMAELTTSQLATKKDIQEIKLGIQELRLELLIKLGGVIVVCSTILGTILSVVMKAH
ncbi:MAG: DUF1640 domain-containing protein [Gammaproteobacteria bacterium]|nr:DUF1640 domain-containing protein [Gammaproteobacteria bacterium]